MNQLQHTLAALDAIASRMPGQGLLTEISVPFPMGITVTIQYVLEGRYWPATECDPEEFPQVRVEKCFVRWGEAELDRFGDVPFDFLPDDIQEQCRDAARLEAMP